MSWFADFNGKNQGIILCGVTDQPSGFNSSFHGFSARAVHPQMIADGFSVIAMVALISLIALQILGLLYKIKSGKEGIKP